MLRNHDMAALLSSLGILSIVLTPQNKIPRRGSNGSKDGTLNLERIEEWLSETDNNGNLAICTGSVSTYDHMVRCYGYQPYTRVIAFDDDSHSHGCESLMDKFESETGFDLHRQSVPAEITCHGNYQYYLADPQGLIRKGGANGQYHCDVRADGNYAVIYPSTVIDNETGEVLSYKPLPGQGFQELELPEIDEAWLEFYRYWDSLRSNSKKQRSSANLSDTHSDYHNSGKSYYSTINIVPVGGVSEGGRNDWLTSVAGGLQALGLSDDCISDMMHVINETVCTPPEDARKVDAIIRSVCSYRKGKTGWLSDRSDTFTMIYDFLSYQMSKQYPLELTVNLLKLFNSHHGKQKLPPNDLERLVTNHYRSMGLI